LALANTTAFLKLRFAQLDARGFEFINELEQLFLPTDELGTRFTALAIGLGHLPHRLEVLGRQRDVSRSALTTIGKDGAGVKLTARAMAGWFAALAPQGVERAGQQGFATEASFQQGWQE
jgi:hypothetical protein